MTRSEIIKVVAENLELSKKLVDDVIYHAEIEIGEALKARKSVMFSGFGTWTTEDKPERSGVSNLNGEKFRVLPKRKVKFKPGKGLQRIVNE